MNINQLSGGTPQVFRKHLTGQNVDTGSSVEGQYQIAYSRGTIPERWDVEVTMIASLDAPAIGGNAIHSHQSNEILARQIEELCANYKSSPCYIQWFAGGTVTRAQTPHDGWYLIENVTSDYTNTQFGIVSLKFKVVFLYAEGTPPVHTASMWWGGGTRITTYSGLATPWTPYPPNGIYSLGTDTTHRVGAEATIPFYVSSTSTIANPIYFQYGATISNWFLGGCHIYDTVNTASWPVPTTTFVNAQWVEVFSRKHVFSGDVWITNGLVSLLIQTGASPGMTVYAWDTTGTPQWRSRGNPRFQDNAFNIASVLGLQFITVGSDNLNIKVLMGTATAQFRVWLAMQRGEYAIDFGLQPLTVTSSNPAQFHLLYAVNPKIIANESSIVDQATQLLVGLSPSSVYGWALGFSASDNLLTLMLWQSVPTQYQPYLANLATVMGIGDGTVPTVNLIRWYSLAFVPLANVANLQAEAESGALGTGWTSGTTIAGFSGSGEAILASGTAAGNADLFGTSYVPTAGQYDVWVRVAVSAHTSAVSQWQMGLWDSTSSAFVASTSYAPNNAVFTANNTFIWIRVATNTTPTAAHNMQFRVVTTATTDTVLYVDQAVLIPKTAAQAGNSYAFPQDIWQQDIWGTTFAPNHHA